MKEAARLAREEAEKAEQARAAVEEDLRELDDLRARGQGDSERAIQLKFDIELNLAWMRVHQDAVHWQNRIIRELREENPCPPDHRHSSVPLNRCEAGVLAQVNAARADPPAYAAGLRGARGRYAEEARAFLAGRQPVAALVADPRLMAAARAHGADLAARDVADHRGAAGQGLLERFRGQGMNVSLAAELISTQRDTPAAVVQSLVIDEGVPGGPHRRDLFNGVFSLVGIACVETRSHGQVVVIDLSNAPVM